MRHNAAESLLLFQLDHLTLIDVACLIFPVMMVSILFWNFDYLKKRGWRNFIGIAPVSLLTYLGWYITGFIKYPPGTSFLVIKDSRTYLIFILLAVSHGVPSAAYGINRLIQLMKKPR